MFKKMITNFKKNLKNKTNISSLFNYNSNPSEKSSSTMDDFIEISNVLSESNYHEKNYLNDKQGELFTNFLKDVISIIIDSRKERTNNDFSLNTSKDSDTYNNDFDEKSFIPEIDDLFLFNDLNQYKNGLQKFVIDFYLIKKKGNKQIKELVERWKFAYNLDDINKVQDANYFPNKIKLHTKGIVSYTRLLPLYQFILSNKNNDNYSLSFQFYQKKSKTKGVFLDVPSGNVLLKNSDLFSFKLKIKYYNLKELRNIFEKDGNNVDIYLPTKIKSFPIKRGKFNLNGFESKNKISNDNNPINNINNDEKYIKTCQTYVNKDKINDIDCDSNNSSFCLVLDSEEENKNIINNEKKYNNNKNIQKRKCSFFSNIDDTTEDYSPRNSNTNCRTSQKSDETNSSLFLTRKNTIKTNNKKINNILKEYFSVKDMSENLNSSLFIKTDEFINFCRTCD